MSDEDGDRRLFDSDGSIVETSSEFSDVRSVLSVVDNFDEGNDDFEENKEFCVDADDEMSTSGSHISLNLIDIPMQVSFRAEEQQVDPFSQIIVAEVLENLRGFDPAAERSQITENIEKSGQNETEKTSPERDIRTGSSKAVCHDEEHSVKSPELQNSMTEMKKKLRSYDAVAALDASRDVGRSNNAPAPIHKKEREKKKTVPEGSGETNNGPTQTQGIPAENEMMDRNIKAPKEGTNKAEFNPAPFGRGLSAGDLVLRLHEMKYNPIPHAVGGRKEAEKTGEATSFVQATVGGLFLPDVRSSVNSNTKFRKKRERKATDSSSSDGCGKTPPKRQRKKKPSNDRTKTGRGVKSHGRGNSSDALSKLVLKIKQSEKEHRLDAGRADSALSDEDNADTDLIPKIDRRIVSDNCSSSSDEDKEASPKKSTRPRHAKHSDRGKKEEKRSRKKKGIASSGEEKQAKAPANRPEPLKRRRVIAEMAKAQIKGLYKIVMEHQIAPGDKADTFFGQVFGLFRDIGMVQDRDLRATFQEAQSRAANITRSFFPKWIPPFQRQECEGLTEESDEKSDDEQQEEVTLEQDEIYKAVAEITDENIEELNGVLENDELNEPVGEELPFDGEFPMELVDEAYDSDISSTGIYELIDDGSLEILESSASDRETTPFWEQHTETSISSESSPVKHATGALLQGQMTQNSLQELEHAAEASVQRQTNITEKDLQKIFCKCTFNYIKHMREKYIQKILQADTEHMLDRDWKKEADELLKDGEDAAQVDE